MKPTFRVCSKASQAGENSQRNAPTYVVSSILTDMIFRSNHWRRTAQLGSTIKSAKHPSLSNTFGNSKSIKYTIIFLSSILRIKCKKIDPIHKVHKSKLENLCWNTHESNCIKSKFWNTLTKTKLLKNWLGDSLMIQTIHPTAKPHWKSDYRKKPRISTACWEQFFWAKIWMRPFLTLAKLHVCVLKSLIKFNLMKLSPYHIVVHWSDRNFTINGFQIS